MVNSCPGQPSRLARAASSPRRLVQPSNAEGQQRRSRRPRPGHAGRQRQKGQRGGQRQQRRVMRRDQPAAIPSGTAPQGGRDESRALPQAQVQSRAAAGPVSLSEAGARTPWQHPLPVASAGPTNERAKPRGPTRSQRDFRYGQIKVLPPPPHPSQRGPVPSHQRRMDLHRTLRRRFRDQAGVNRHMANGAHKPRIAQDAARGSTGAYGAIVMTRRPDRADPRERGAIAMRPGHGMAQSLGRRGIVQRANPGRHQYFKTQPRDGGRDDRVTEMDAPLILAMLHGANGPEGGPCISSPAFRSKAGMAGCKRAAGQTGPCRGRSSRCG